MSDGSRALSVKGYARLGGLGYLTIIVTGIFAG